jgi:C-terminal processing protease CtpA/Prc
MSPLSALATGFADAMRCGRRRIQLTKGLLALAMLAALGLGVSQRARAQQPEYLSAAQRAADFAAFCDFVAESYAYFDLKRTDWSRACRHYAAQVPAATLRPAYISLLERALGELFDAHAHLGTNTPASFRLVPSQTDLVGHWQGEMAFITAVRADSAAARAGLRPGMQVIAVQGEDIREVVKTLKPRFVAGDDPAPGDWALQLALAGRHQDSRTRLTIRMGQGPERQMEFAPARAAPTALLSSRAIGPLATVRIHNTLGDQALVAAFDKALLELQGAIALVIDLRDTPSGGNSSVARGMLGRLVDRMLPYQRHELVSEFRATGVRRVWDEYVLPRGQPFLKPVVVLVGPWTGSMGEGLAIGLNATRGAAVLGQPMAKLLGANAETVLPHSNIVVRLPAEKLFHVDGTPREAALPCAVATAARDDVAKDSELEAALALAADLAASRPHAPLPPGCLGPRATGSANGALR